MEEQEGIPMSNWRGESHYAGGAGMSTAALVCAMSNRPDAMDIPKRGTLPIYESQNQPTCKFCLQVAWDLEHYQDNTSINPYD